ncbi:phage tail protein [Limosilactobacillus reuteri]|uniref:phage tail protein n=1 Tax=Limosilactobacillus reuteri TaxID=1598 RepID=UPI002AAB72AD|nr:phage tail protein [Limosilactobacillus reuteri]WPU43972.1 phage tail protein [Limosilactobacillus reuteri]
MLIHGIKKAWVGLKTADGRNLATGDSGLSQNGIYELDHNVLGVASAELKGLDGSKLEKISGNNTVQYSYADPLNPQATISINNMPMEALAKLIGMEKQGTGMQMADTKPVGFFVVQAPSMTTNDSVYFAFPSGNFLMGDKKLDTDTDTKKTPVTDQLTFAAIDDPNINDLYRIYSTADPDWKDEDTMFKELFPNYTASASAAPTPAASAHNA